MSDKLIADWADHLRYEIDVLLNDAADLFLGAPPDKAPRDIATAVRRAVVMQIARLLTFDPELAAHVVREELGPKAEAELAALAQKEHKR